MADKDKSKLEQSRRRFLKTATKLAVYTPPAMLAVSAPGFAKIAQSGGNVHELRVSKKRKKKSISKKKSYEPASKKTKKKKNSKKKTVSEKVTKKKSKQPAPV